MGRLKAGVQAGQVRRMICNQEGPESHGHSTNTQRVEVRGRGKHSRDGDTDIKDELYYMSLYVNSKIGGIS